MGFLNPLGLLGLGISALGGKGGRSKGGQSQQMSGWQALPQEVKDVYLQQYLPGVTGEFNQEMSPQVQEVYNQYSGGLPGLMESIPEYVKFFQQNVDDPTFSRIQEDADMQKNSINALAARSGLGGLFNSNLGVQLSQLQKNADDRKANYSYQMNKDNLSNALGLRDKTLGELMKSGDQNYDRLARLAALLGAFPGGSTQTSIGPSVSGPNIFDRLGGGLTALSSMGNNGGFLGGLFQ